MLGIFPLSLGMLMARGCSKRLLGSFVSGVLASILLLTTRLGVHDQSPCGMLESSADAGQVLSMGIYEVSN